METTTTAITVYVNGQPHTLPEVPTLDALLRHLGRDPGMPGIAIALNDAIVRRNEWASTLAHDRDRVEVITASQGG